MIARRPFLKLLTTSLAGIAIHPTLRAADEPKFPIGACDWTMGKKQDIGAFELATAIGLEGLQVSFSTPNSEYDLRNKAIREQYYRRSDETGVRIASLGMGILNKMPLATHPEAIGWVDDAIDVMAQMKKEQPGNAPSNCLLAFFGRGDINGKPDLMDIVAKKLKTIAKKAEDNGVVFGIESLLSGEDHLRIIDQVGSNAIQVYYDSANSDRMGYNIYDEVIQIGGDRICEVHCKENGALIGQGKIDFRRFKQSLTKAQYQGWLIIEGSRPKSADLVESYRANAKHLKSVFRNYD